MENHRSHSKPQTPSSALRHTFVLETTPRPLYTSSSHTIYSDRFIPNRTGSNFALFDLSFPPPPHPGPSSPETARSTNFGRLEIKRAEVEMPGLMACRSEYGTPGGTRTHSRLIQPLPSLLRFSSARIPLQFSFGQIPPPFPPSPPSKTVRCFPEQKKIPIVIASSFADHLAELERALACSSSSSDAPLVILGHTSDRETLGALILTILVVFLPSIGSLLISALMVGAAIVAIHGAFRMPEDLFLDNQEPSSTGSGFLSFLGGAATYTGPTVSI